MIDIRKELTTWSATLRSVGGGLIETFVLRNGIARQGSPFKGKRGRAKDCFSNAATLSLGAGGYYVEGYAIRPNIGLAIHHAWVEQVGGKVVDMTWEEPETCVYMGVSFTPQELRRELVINRYYGLFIPDIEINIRLLLERDPGLRELFPQLVKWEARNAKTA